MTKKTKNKYNHYTEDFRREAVRRSDNPDSSAAEVATEAEKQELVSALTGKLYAVERWIDSFPQGKMSDEAAALMYMGEAIDELGLDIEYGQPR